MGRGLDALIAATNGDSASQPAAPPTCVAVDRIKQNPFQPRKTFDPDELNSLSESIRTLGVLQPILVRSTDDGYQLVAGERRLRAAQAAGVTEVPVRIVDLNDQQTFEASLVENIHRTDLNPIEKAQGFRDYLERFQMNHDQLAERLGLGRTTITNLVSLLELEPEVQEAIRVNQITLGHAKVLKGVKDRDRQLALLRQVIAQGLSVHAMEALLKDQRDEADEPASKQARSTPEKTAHVESIENELRQKLLTRVEIKLKGKDRGQIVLSFESNDDFERILEVLQK
jgi:ParB family chromosome partitioning protein